ncbi:MAG: BACON domain-containing carbohydrate-binding protein [Acidobacteriota bacterium]
MKKKARAEKTRRGKVAAMILIVCLALGTGALAGLKLFSSNEEQIAPAALTPSTPAKEYYYAGGKLVATEQTETSSSCSYSISPASQNFAASGGTGSVNVTADVGCAWTAVSNSTDWITITAGASGSGNGAVSYSVASNTLTTPRAGTMTIAGQTFTVNQDPASAGCTYSISPTNNSVGAASGSGTVDVTSQTGCSWTASSNATWISITSGASGAGNGTVSYSFNGNTGAARSGSITVAGQTFTLNQAACTYTISPTSQTFSASGGTGNITVTPNVATCQWTATSNDSWITITAGASGAGNGSVSFSVSTNPLTTSRTGTMTIAGQTFTVTQSGNSCSYSLSPTSSGFPASGDNGTVNVTAGAGCAWTAASNVAWITITSGATGSGNGAVNYTVEANPTTSSRQGTITIAGQTHTVTQAPNCNYTLTPTSQNFISAGGTGQISVETAAECTWIANPSDSWITITAGASGTGNGTISYSVSANTGPARTGTINVNGQMCFISQDTGCTYSISPTSQSFPSTGGSGSVTVTTNNGFCSWTATTADSWISITSGASGTGNGTVTFTVANNSGATRTGTITIAGQTFTVTQAGSGGVCQVSTFAGNGSASYAEGTGISSKWNSPNSSVIAKHPQTSLYALFIADTENHRIRMIYLEGPNVGKTSLIAGSGVAGYLEGTGATARFNNPRGIAAIKDANGVVTTLLVADTSNHCIRKLTYSAGSWTSAIFSGKGGAPGYTDGAASTSRFNSPQGMVVSPDTFIYVSDTGNAKVRKLTSTGTSSTLAVTGGLNTPLGVTVGGAGNMLYISDVVRHSIWQVNPSTAAGTKLAGADVAGFADGTGTAARFNYPAHLAFTSTGGDTVFIADRSNNRIRKLVVSSTAVTTYAGTGTAGYADGSCTAAQFNLPYGVSYGLTGELYVIDTENNRIRKAQ